MKLLFEALLKFIFGILLVGAPLFLPAGTLSFPNAWLFMGLLFIPMLLLGTLLLFKAPKLLKKRLDVKEKEGAQKGVVAFSGLLFLAGFIIAGLDHRFAWSQMPIGITAAAAIVLLFSYGLYAEVMRENAYLSRTIEVQNGQTVVDTGLYGIVRHPMYAVTLWLFLAIPLVLGSWWAFLCFLPNLPLFIVRILHEERFLETNLNGYKEYKKKVKYRLIPFIW